jgi:hypothetical protein
MVISWLATVACVGHSHTACVHIGHAFLHPALVGHTLSCSALHRVAGRRLLLSRAVTDSVCEPPFLRIPIDIDGVPCLPTGTCVRLRVRALASEFTSGCDDCHFIVLTWCAPHVDAITIVFGCWLRSRHFCWRGLCVHVRQICVSKCRWNLSTCQSVTGTPTMQTNRGRAKNKNKTV